MSIGGGMGPVGGSGGNGAGPLPGSGRLNRTVFLALVLGGMVVLEPLPDELSSLPAPPEGGLLSSGGPPPPPPPPGGGGGGGGAGPAEPAPLLT